MNKTLAGACILMLGGLTASAADYMNDKRYDNNDMDPAQSYKIHGDCLGLSPVVFGQEGPYVSSDLQFA